MNPVIVYSPEICLVVKSFEDEPMYLTDEQIQPGTVTCQELKV